MLDTVFGSRQMLGDAVIVVIQMLGKKKVFVEIIRDSLHRPTICLQLYLLTLRKPLHTVLTNYQNS
jgi:hypothetical protein